MTLKKIIEIFGATAEIYFHIMDEDIEGVLIDELSQNKNDYSGEEWQQLISDCGRAVHKYLEIQDTLAVICEPVVKKFKK